MHRIPKDVSGCFAVIFSYQLSDNLSGYREMDIKTLELVKDIDGYLGYEKYGDGKQNTFISKGAARRSIVYALYKLFLRQPTSCYQFDVS